MQKMLKYAWVRRNAPKKNPQRHGDEKMIEIRIFIASCNDEADERTMLKELVSKIDDVTRSYKVRVEPEMWELKSTEMRVALERAQNFLNEALISSDIAFFLFGKRVGKYTLEEFEKACEEVKNNSTPLKVFAYFKNVPIGDTSTISNETLDAVAEIKKLKEIISEMGQIYGEYRELPKLQSSVIKDVLGVVISKVLEESKVDVPKLDVTMQKLVKFYNQADNLYQADDRNNIISDAVDSMFFLANYNYKPN
jgi:hypothetical protein